MGRVSGHGANCAIAGQEIRTSAAESTRDACITPPLLNLLLPERDIHASFLQKTAIGAYSRFVYAAHVPVVVSFHQLQCQSAAPFLLAPATTSRDVRHE